MQAVFLFCRDAGTGPDGKMDIHGVFNELLAPDFPAKQDRMVLAGIIEWKAEVSGQVPFKMDLMDPGGLSIFTIDGHTDVEPRPPSRAPTKTQFVLPMTNVMFPAPGRYQMRIELGNDRHPDGRHDCQPDFQFGVFRFVFRLRAFLVAVANDRVGHEQVDGDENNTGYDKSDVDCGVDHSPIRCDRCKGPGTEEVKNERTHYQNN